MVPRVTPRRTVAPLAVLAAAHLEYVLLGLLAALSIVLALVIEEPSSMALDVVTSLVAAATVRYPRVAGAILAGLLAAYALTPDTWFDLGLYTPVIVVLGLGMRGQLNLRRALSALYLVVLAILQYGLFTNEGVVAVVGGLGGERRVDGR